MTAETIIELLTWANGHEATVKVVLRDGTEVIGTPMGVDLDPTAYEVFLHPPGDDDTEIGVSLAAIRSAEMI